MVLGSVKDKITKEYLRQSQIKNKIHTKANAHTGTPTICTRWIGYTPKQTLTLERLPFALLDWIQTKATPTLERLLFASLDWIHTKANAHTGTPTICTRWIGYRQLERLPFAHAGLIQTTGTPTICPTIGKR